MACAYAFLIRLYPAKSGNQHKQGRFRQMEIRDQVIDCLELITRSDEKRRFVTAGFQFTGLRSGFQRTKAGRADADDLVFALLRGFDGFDGFFGNGVPLGMHLVF